MKRGSVTNRLLDRHIGIPVLFLTSIFSRRRTLPGCIHRIGILASPTLGDTLLNSAAIQDLRLQFPDSILLFFCAPSNAAAAALLPDVDEIVAVKMTEPLTTVRKMRSCKLDLLVDFTSWQRLTAFFTAFSGATFRVGFRTGGQHRHWHYDLTATHSSKVHEVENFRAILRALGVPCSSGPKLKLPGTLNSSVHIGPRPRLVVFHPWATGDRHAYREWPNGHWVELARELSKGNTEFLITGAPSQQPRSLHLCDQLISARVSAKPYLATDGLSSLCHLLLSADLVVSVNTGIMHLAAIIGAPTISLNGPNSSRRWGPVGPNARSVDPTGGGGGYLNLGFEFDGNPADCMQRTRVSDVLSVAQELAPQLFAGVAVHTAASSKS